VTCCGRREVLAASGVVASAVFVSGCGSDDDTPTPDSGEGGDGDAGSAAGGDAIASVGDVPVGGGVVVQAEQVVITQPSDGEFKAFSAVCPHQGCLVTDVRDGEIVCPCHGSRFAVETGEVVGGPAPRGLEEREVTVTGDGITVA
jgi:Rieske Fe-S protein